MATKAKKRLGRRSEELTPVNIEDFVQPRIEFPHAKASEDELADWAIKNSIVVARYLVHVITQTGFVSDADYLHFHIDAHAKALMDNADSIRHFQFLKGFTNTETYHWNAFQDKLVRQVSNPSAKRVFGWPNRSDGILNAATWEKFGPKTDEFDIIEGLYPSVYHLYVTLFMLHAWGTSITDSDESDVDLWDNIKTLDEHGQEIEEDRILSATSLLQELLCEDVIESHLYRFRSGYKANLELADSESSFTGKCKYREIYFTWLAGHPRSAVVYPVEVILAGKDAIYAHRRKVSGRDEPGMGLSARSIAEEDFAFYALQGVLIEGIHFNRHKFHLIEHLVVRSPDARRYALNKAMTGIYPSTGFGFSSESLNLRHLFFDVDSPDKYGEMVVVDDLILVGCEVDLLACMSEWSTKFRIDPEIKEARILQSLQSDLLKSLDKIASEENDVYRKLMRLKEQRTRVKMELDILTVSSRNLLEALKAELAGMGMISKVDLLEGFHLAVETEDIWATNERDDNPLYVGRFQFLFHPLTGELQMRNIAAPISVYVPRSMRLLIASGKAIKTKPGLSDIVINAVIHPHSSGEDQYNSTTICIGGFVEQLSPISNAYEEVTRQDIAIRQIRVALRFLQSYKTNDAYCVQTLPALLEKRPVNTAVTSWQELCPAQVGCGMSLDFTDVLDTATNMTFVRPVIAPNKLRGLQLPEKSFNLDTLYEMIEERKAK